MLKQELAVKEKRIWELSDEVDEAWKFSEKRFKLVQALLSPSKHKLIPHLRAGDVHVRRMEVTAYDAHSAVSINVAAWRDGKTSMNIPAVVGKTIAVDPNIIPLGTWVWIDTIGWRRAEDTGGLIKGNTIDVLMTNVRQARKFGRKHLVALWKKTPEEPKSDPRSSVN